MKQLISASDANDQIDAYGTAILEPRINNMQLNFFSEGEYALAPDSDSLDLTTALTMEVWFDPTGSDYFNYIFCKWDSTNSKRSYGIFQNANGTIRALLSGDGSSTYLENYLRFAGIHCYHFVYESGVGSSFYQDGVLQSPASMSGILPTSLFLTDTPITIGARPELTDGFTNHSVGSAKIYNTALTAEEVLQNYESQKSKYGL